MNLGTSTEEALAGAAALARIMATADDMHECCPTARHEAHTPDCPLRPENYAG